VLFRSLYLNADKRSVTLDVASAEGHRLLGRLIERAGVVLLGLAPQEQERLGLSAKGLRAGREGLVVTSLTPFGTKGPYKDYRSYDLTAIHWGGLAHITPRFNSDPEQEPLRPDGYLSEFIAGLHGALATVAAALRCDGPGAGGAGLDISTWEAVLYNLPLRIAERTYARTSSPRLSKPTFAPFHFFRCRDGYVFIMTTERHQWDALVELMGKPEWALADYLQDGVARAEAWDAIEPLISDFLKDYTAEELYRKGSALRLPCARSPSTVCR
jgi:crotonobetainyl-CoA:carnitine CoA-transferase CaiB-like acyl-CoA transferase